MSATQTRRPLAVEPVTPETTPAPPAGRGIVPHLPAVVIFAIATILLTWPLVLHMDNTAISWGDPLFQAWTIAWDWHALTTDPLRIFDANVFYPWRNTLAWSDHLFGQALLVAPVMAIADNGILANNIAVFMAFCFSALAMYLLVYDLTGNRAAGVIAGIAYAFAPSRMAHLEHLHLLSMQWPPLILLCLRRIVRPVQHRIIVRNILPLGMRQLESATLFAPPRRATVIRDNRLPWYLGLGACFFAQGLFGIYFFYFTIVMLVIVGGVYGLLAVLSPDRDWSVLQRLAAAGLACGIAGALLIPTLWPYQQVHTDLDIERTEAEVTLWSADLADYLAVSPRTRAWNETLDSNHRNIEQDLFPGLLLLCLAGIGLTHSRAGRERWVLLAVALGSILLSFGLEKEWFGVSVPGPYRIFYDTLPGFRAIRVPARLGLLALVGLGGLAGLGVDRIWRILKHELPLFPRYPNRLARQPIILGALTALLALSVLGVETATRMELPEPLPKPDTNARADYRWLQEHPAPTIELPMGEGPVASAWPNFWAMGHWTEVVNGYSGIVPPTYYPLRERMRAFPDADTLWLLQGMGIENIMVHMPFEERRRLKEAAAEFPELTLALDGRDSAYTLAPDPWMWALAEAIPGGETVDLPNVESDPLMFGLLMAILQRTDHTVTGNGQVDYFTFPPGGQNACYAVLNANDAPSFFGYLGATAVLEAGEMVVYKRGGCG